MALAIVRAKAAGRRWFVEWDGTEWWVLTGKEEV